MAVPDRCDSDRVLRGLRSSIAAGAGSRQSPAAGSELELELVSSIDSEMSYAGEAIEASLVRPVRDSKGETIPAGTIVRGDLAQLQNILYPRKTVIIALRFDAIVIDGIDVPVALKPEGRSDARGRGVFVFEKSRVEMEKEFQIPLARRATASVTGYRL
jgi:hypothetical protein